jgi:hypothetical protein
MDIVKLEKCVLKAPNSYYQSHLICMSFMWATCKMHATFNY